ncbi:MAG: hypothetical protein K2Z81_12835, partial [Cyanobacteria bacterium]|nr:hypothetical protein [Cyanobacteriota bacterium]
MTTTPPRPDMPEISDASTTNSYIGMCDVASLNDLKSFDPRASITDTASKHLRPLEITGIVQTDRHTEGKDKSVTVSDDKGARISAKFRDGNLVEVTDPNKVKWTQQKDGTWRGVNAENKVVGRADSIKVVGEGKDMQVVRTEGNKTTVRRADGSSIEEVKGENGSRRITVMDKDGKAVAAIHNGKEFSINGKDVYQGGKRVGEYDSATRNITIESGKFRATLKGDGTTHAVNKDTGHSITGFGDGARIYKDGTGKVLALRDADRNHLVVGKDGALVVTDRSGRELKSHPLHGKTPLSLDPKTGECKIKDPVFKDAVRCHHLDKSVRSIDAKDGGPIRTTDAKGRTYNFEYKPGGKRTEENLARVTRGGEVVFDAAKGDKLRMSPAKGDMTVVKGDGRKVNYDMRSGAEVMAIGDAVEKSFRRIDPETKK